MVNAIGDAVRFMETISGEALHNLNRADFYTSHEALLLPYEESMTRQVPRPANPKASLYEQGRFKKSSRPASASSKAPTRRSRSKSGRSMNTASD